MSGCAATRLDDVAGIDWRCCTNNHRDVTHEDARRYYAHFGHREWARLAKSRRRPARVHFWMHSAAPAPLRRYRHVRSILQLRRCLSLCKCQFDGAAAEATRWTQQEPVGWHHGQELFGETAQLRRGLYARILYVDDACPRSPSGRESPRRRRRSAHWCVDHSAPRFKRSGFPAHAADVADAWKWQVVREHQGVLAPSAFDQVAPRLARQLRQRVEDR